MIIAFGSFIWHMVLDLLGIAVAFILLFIIGVVIYTLFQQYIKDKKQATFIKWLTPIIHDVSALQIEVSKLKSDRKFLEQHASDLTSKDGDDNGTKKD